MSESKPDLVLVHGWASGPFVWSAIVPELECRFRVHQVTLPGYGAGGAVFPGSAKLLADWLRARTPANAAWLAWSTAGLPACLLAAGSRPHVSRLNLVSGVVRFTRGSGWPWGASPDVIDSFREGLRRDPRALLERFARLVVQPGAGRELERAFADGFVEDGIPLDALHAGLTLLAHADVREALAGIEVPAAFFHGERDRVVDPGSSRAASEAVPDGRLALLEGSGHAPFFTDPQRFLARFYDEGRY